MRREGERDTEEESRERVLATAKRQEIKRQEAESEESDEEKIKKGWQSPRRWRIY